MGTGDVKVSLAVLCVRYQTWIESSHIFPSGKCQFLLVVLSLKKIVKFSQPWDVVMDAMGSNDGQDKIKTKEES